jgi:RNA polymerase sigma-70 factor (ECF subfamily)
MASWAAQVASSLAVPDRAPAAASGALWQRVLLAIGDVSRAVTATAVPTTRRALPQGDISEFEPLFRAHEHDIFTYLWRMTGDEQAAYDLAQETFLRAWRHFARIRAYERPGGWLLRVATHLALNHLRNRATSLGAAVSLEAADIARHSFAPSTAASDPGARVADADTERRALMALPPRQRAALVLREVYGLSCREVAAALGISAGAAKTLLWRARDELRERYAEEAC